MDLLLGLGIGALGGAALAWAVTAARRTRLAVAEARVVDLADQVEEARREREGLCGRLEETERRREAAELQVARLQEQVEAGNVRLAEQVQLLDRAKAQFNEAFRSVGAQALEANNRQFLELASASFERLLTSARGDGEKRQQAIDGLVQPIRELIAQQNRTLGELEKKRAVETGSIEQQLKAMATAHERLGAETGRLVTALRRPEQRGRWGEMQLRNVVEMAGMTAHCDFVEQPTTRCEGGVQRPDMIVRLPGDGVIVVDSKVALDAYLDAIEPDADCETLMQRHARQVAEHVRGLASRRYWEQFERTPKIVVMFMPLEAALVSALQVKPELHNDAMRAHVLIASPTLLVAMLRAVAYGWQQEDVAENARAIARTGRDLYRRLAHFVDGLEKVGTGLQRAAKSYNAAIGSLEARVLPSARSLKELHATTEADIDVPKRLSGEVRSVVAAELKGIP